MHQTYLTTSHFNLFLTFYQFGNISIQLKSLVFYISYSSVCFYTSSLEQRQTRDIIKETDIFLNSLESGYRDKYLLIIFLHTQHDKCTRQLCTFTLSGKIKPCNLMTLARGSKQCLMQSQFHPNQETTYKDCPVHIDRETDKQTDRRTV